LSDFEPQRIPRRVDRRFLLTGFLSQYPQRREIVFHFLKRGQHGLPVRRYCGVVCGLGLQ
jgi:hypothetical protein